MLTVPCKQPLKRENLRMSDLYTVICTLPNAAETIDGIDFDLVIPAGRAAHGVSADKAERFGKIPGYTIQQEEGGSAEPQGSQPPAVVQHTSDSVPTANPETAEGGSVPQTPETTTGAGDAGNAVTPIAEMNAPQVVALLKEHPTAYPEAEAAEAARKTPRKAVVEAIEAAKEQAKPQGDNPPPTGD
ncbi:MAG TPA: hypothetical protein VFL54_10010 [Gammaproteobacteria bacterium]|nr:hypothetical protein [Gammaproteobacteria bacterium]